MSNNNANQTYKNNYPQPQIPQQQMANSYPYAPPEPYQPQKQQLYDHYGPVDQVPSRVKQYTKMEDLYSETNNNNQDGNKCKNNKKVGIQGQDITADFNDYEPLLEQPKKPKTMTIRDVEEKMRKEDEIGFGQACLQETNTYRKSCGLQPLVWSEELYWIARIHSKNMAEKKVKFGHDGFNNRAAMVPFDKEFFAENVANCDNYARSEVPSTIVNGWINSEGHRKNLLSPSNVCGIAAYKGLDDVWYFTQLFCRIRY